MVYLLCLLRLELFSVQLRRLPGTPTALVDIIQQVNLPMDFLLEYLVLYVFYYLLQNIYALGIIVIPFSMEAFFDISYEKSCLNFFIAGQVYIQTHYFKTYLGLVVSPCEAPGDVGPCP